MNSDPRGLAVIIDNEFFLKLPARYGTDYDREMLKNLFTQLKFKVVPYDYLSASVSLVHIVCGVATVLEL